MPMTLADIAAKLKDIDFCMLETRAADGSIAGRPMSNNQEVEYDGDSWFFSSEDSDAIAQIAANPAVALAYQGSAGLLGMVGKPGAFYHIQGEAEVIRDKATFAEHWHAGLKHWYPEGIDTPGMVMIKVHATRIHYWDGEENGEVPLGAQALAH